MDINIDDTIDSILDFGVSERTGLTRILPATLMLVKNVECVGDKHLRSVTNILNFSTTLSYQPVL